MITLAKRLDPYQFLSVVVHAHFSSFTFLSLQSRISCNSDKTSGLKFSRLLTRRSIKGANPD